MVKIKRIRDLIAEHPFFAGMEPRYLDLIAGCGELAHFRAGEFLMKEGEDAARFFLIRKGAVAIETFCPVKGALTVARAGEGDVVGFSWLFPPYRVTFDAHALTAVDTIALYGACFRGNADKDHELGYELITRFSRLLLEQLSATRRQLLDVYGGTDASAKSEQR